MVAVAGPRGPFDPLEWVLDVGAPLYRVYSTGRGRTANGFNPGFGAPSRFAFFADTAGDTVPVLYAAATEQAAVCETLLHELPASGGVLTPAHYRTKVMARIRPAQQLRLASFMGTGLRALKIEHTDLTSTSPARYSQTVQWAKSAHRAGFDGLVWMSHRCNAGRAFMLFGDRVEPGGLIQDDDYGRAFEMAPDREWLTDLCVPLHAEVRW